MINIRQVIKRVLSICGLLRYVRIIKRVLFDKSPEFRIFIFKHEYVFILMRLCQQILPASPCNMVISIKECKINGPVPLMKKSLLNVIGALLKRTFFGDDYSFIINCNQVVAKKNKSACYLWDIKKPYALLGFPLRGYF